MPEIKSIVFKNRLHSETHTLSVGDKFDGGSIIKIRWDGNDSDDVFVDLTSGVVVRVVLPVVTCVSYGKESYEKEDNS